MERGALVLTTPAFQRSLQATEGHHKIANIALRIPEDGMTEQLSNKVLVHDLALFQ